MMKVNFVIAADNNNTYIGRLMPQYISVGAIVVFCCCKLSLTMLRTNSAVDKLVIFFLCYLENRSRYFIQNVFLEDKFA